MVKKVTKPKSITKSKKSPAKTKQNKKVTKTSTKTVKVSKSKVIAREICVLAELTPKQGKKDELMKVFKPLIENTRKEPGCIIYDCCEKFGSNDLIFFEKYKSEEELERHMKNDHFTKAYPEVVKLIDGDVRITRCPKWL